MNTTELKKLISDMSDKTREVLSRIYSDISEQQGRILAAIDKFEELFGKDREVYLLSVPGRSEILGNHTDHNNGCVLAGAIDRDIIAIAAKNGTDSVNLKSEGYEKSTVSLDKKNDKNAYPKYTSESLVLGIAGGFSLRGLEVGGFDAYATSDVLKGSGISSSAAFEVMIGNIFSHLFNGGKVENEELAKIAQYAENEYFGKPCGLMDQMACAVGGFVYIDFEKTGEPKIVPIAFSLKDAGYRLSIVNTGGNHADLNEDYASVPAEMKSVARELGFEVLRPLSEEDIIKNATALRESVGDRAILRAIHFVRENKRVEAARAYLEGASTEEFFSVVKASGRSSFEYLQNVYTNKNVTEQGLSLALLLTEGFLGESGAFRVHGGGFAGTVQAYVKAQDSEAYAALMESVFGAGAVMNLNIRPLGACRLF